MRSKNSWALLLMMLTGIVIGGLLGQLLPSSFLNYGQSCGLTSLIVLDLGILVLTFGLTIHITVASIIGMVIAIILYRFL